MKTRLNIGEMLQVNVIIAAFLDQGDEKKEKKRKDCTFRRQFIEKPSSIPGCPGHWGDALGRCHGSNSVVAFQELKEYRRAGIRTFADAELYEADKKRKSTVQPSLPRPAPGSLPRNWQYPGSAAAEVTLSFVSVWMIIHHIVVPDKQPPGPSPETGSIPDLLLLRSGFLLYLLR